MTTPSASPTLRRLPLELELAILRFALPAPSFAGWPERAAFLAGAALVCREWTTWAQVELVRDAILPSVKQLAGLMRRLRGGDGTRLTVGKVRSLRLGGVRGANWGGVDGKTRELLKWFNGVEEVWLSGLEHHNVNLKTLADARGLRRLFSSNSLITHNTANAPSFPSLTHLSLSHLPVCSPALSVLLSSPGLTSLSIDVLSPNHATILSSSHTELRHLLQTSFSHTPALPSLVLQGWGKDAVVWSPSATSPVAAVRVAWLEEMAWYPGRDLADYVARHPSLEEIWLPAAEAWEADGGDKEEGCCTLAEVLELCATRGVAVRHAAVASPSRGALEETDAEFNPRFWELVDRMGKQERA